MPSRTAAVTGSRNDYSSSAGSYPGSGRGRSSRRAASSRAAIEPMDQLRLNIWVPQKEGRSFQQDYRYRRTSQRTMYAQYLGRVVHVAAGRVAEPDTGRCRGHYRAIRCPLLSERRRERDSNPRYRLTPYAGLANRCLQPLGHLSGRSRKLLSHRGLFNPARHAVTFPGQHLVDSGRHHLGELSLERSRGCAVDLAGARPGLAHRSTQ